MKKLILATCLSASLLGVSQNVSISNFGANPGNLNAYKYVPASVPANAPLVVVLHGCSQNANGYSSDTQWNTLADTHKFYVLHMEQKTSNNSTTCFNYWEPTDHDRGNGECLSVKQAVDYMKSNYSIDNNKVFVSGLSAGGAFTIVMLAAYPDVFAAGAEMAGLPYKTALNSTDVYISAGGFTNKTPQQWGNLVRGQNPGYTGAYPRIAIFHGTSDATINKNNATETLEQFTDLHNTDQTADYTTTSFNGNSSVQLNKYNNASGQTVVEFYSITGMGHGIAVDPGSCYQQGGTANSYALDVNLYSSFWAARFFGILQPPHTVTGPIQVSTSQQGTTYSVTATGGSTYTWEVPSGATIVSGQGTNSIVVNWGTVSGHVSVTETAGSCKKGPSDLYVTVGATSGIVSGSSEDDFLFTTQTPDDIMFMLRSSRNYRYDVEVLDISGRRIYSEKGIESNRYSTLEHTLTPGLYMMNCTTPGKTIVRKFIVY